MKTIMLTPTQITKQRFKEFKTSAREKNITLENFRNYVLLHNEDYNSPIGWERIRNCWNMRVADLVLTELLTELVNLKNSQYV